MAVTTTRTPGQIWVSNTPPNKDHIITLMNELISATSGAMSDVDTATNRTTIPIVAAATGSGSAYNVTAPLVPIGGQLYYFTPHVDSTTANPTVVISDGTASASAILFSADGGPVTLRGGVPYLVRHGTTVSFVLTQTRFAERRASDISPIRAASATAAPSCYGALQPIVVAGPVPYQAQPFHARSAIQMQGPAGMIDCTHMTPGTQIDIYARLGDRVIAGAGRTFVGRAGGMATGTGSCVLRVLSFYGQIAIEEVCGPSPTYGADDPIPYDATIAIGGQSNANQLGLNGGIGGFSWALRNLVQSPLQQSIRWINGATGGTAIDRRSVPSGSSLYWWDAATDTPGPALETFTDAVDDAIAAGSAVPSDLIWTQGESDAGAIQSGLLTTSDMQATIMAVWAYIRGRYPGIRVIVNAIGSHDARNSDRGANAVRVAYLRATDQVGYAYPGIELYDLQRAEGDVHYFGQAYAAMGARLARVWANLAHGQSNALGPRVISSNLSPNGRTLNLGVDWGGQAFEPAMPNVNGNNPFGIYALAPGADPVSAPIPLMSVEVSGGLIRITSSFSLAGHQVGGPWGYMADARRGHVIRDYASDPHHLMPGQPLRSFLIQL